MSLYPRDVLIFTIIALIVGTVMAAALQHPGYTDAYYYFNAAQRLVQGKGLTDAALWTYIGNPTSLPAPSHLYWMPLPSLIAAFGILIGGPTFDAAQLGFVLMYAGLGLVGFATGALIGGTRRTAWISGLLTLFSGYFMPYWTTTSTFAPFGLLGSLTLLTMGLGRKSGNVGWFALSGALAGLAHLTRADGVLLLLVLIIVIVWPNPSLVNTSGSKSRRNLAVVIGIAAYLIVMAPWFVRNLNVTGAILPAGGLQTAWMRSYDEIANYPPVIKLNNFLSWGTGNILASRWEAFMGNRDLNIGGTLQQFLLQEGLIILMPFMLYGLWQRRKDPLVSGFWLYAIGLHLAMTLVFAFPGYRGGLFHSSAALIPFWSALAIVGLDDFLRWAAPKRRWKLKQAQAVFGSAIAVWAVIFSVNTFIGHAAMFNNSGEYFRSVAKVLPPDTIVIINDPSAMYYYTGISGIVLPNADPTVIPELAKRYGATMLVLDVGGLPLPLRKLYDGEEHYDFLEPLTIYPYNNGTQIYKIKP